MKTLFRALALVLATISAGHAEPLALGRGVGVHEWLNWSPLDNDGAYRWPPYRSQAEWLAGGRPLTDWPDGDRFAGIRAMGFDFVRLTVDPGPLLASEGVRRQQALDVLAAAIGQVTATGLKVVFDLHGVDQVPAYSMEMIYGGAESSGVARYRAMVMEAAAMLAGIGADKVAIEPYNEPAYYPCDASGSGDWQKIMAATVRDIRSVSADLTIVATGACGGSITGLVDLDPGFDDENVLYSFHMYEPHSFTHQRLDDPEGFLSGLPWPADRGTPEAVVGSLRRHMEAAGVNRLRQAANLAGIRSDIRAYFSENWGMAQLEARIGEAKDWAARHGIPSKRLFMGEFGAMLLSADGRTGAPDADRLRYLAAVREEAERAGIPWSVWEYSNPYGMSLILPTGKALPDLSMLKALGLDSGRP